MESKFIQKFIIKINDLLNDQLSNIHSFLNRQILLYFNRLLIKTPFFYLRVFLKCKLGKCQFCHYLASFFIIF
nr:MAG TPA_asm: hypothetical protein [Caudoviricetes sp.]